LNGRGSRLRLRDIRAHGRHGADPGERERPQPFNIDIELEVDLERARRSDQLADTVDYAAIHRRIVEIVGADEILADVMRDDRIAAATITIAKPGLLAGATPAVTIESRRAER
jgi:dihydroneopterin aldolase